MAKYTAKQIQNWDSSAQIKPGVWAPARPLNHTVDGWRRRVVLAWGVLTGKYDALDWQENPND